MKNISLYSILLIGTNLCISTNSICMEKHQNINYIKQQLVIKEIEKYGIEHIQNQIEQTSTITIKDTFYKENKTKDSLTQCIFNTVQAKEKTTEYQPEKTNFLGKETHYWWVNKNNTHSAICIQALLKNREKLQKIVTMYQQKIDNNDDVYSSVLKETPNVKVCIGFISFLCLCSYLVELIQ